MPHGEALTPALLRRWPLPRAEEGDDKHDRGTVLVVGGAVSTPGAPLLAGLGALRAGAGRLQVATVPETAVALAVALPEAMVVGLEHPGEVDVSDADAVLVGPGLLDAEPVLKGVRARLGDVPLVVDARALGCLDGPVPGGVLTPNAGELEHLGAAGDIADMALAVARERQAAVATHGWVASPDGQLWRLEIGGVGLGTSGSGDVLAGIVTGLLARGAEPAQAACWGSYLHAAAGDRLAAVHGRVGYLARELLDEVPALMASLE